MDAKEKLQALDDVVSALAHPARRQILLSVHLVGGSMTAGTIASRFEHAWATTTRHLRVLENAGLLSHAKRGRCRVYRINRDRLALVKDWLGWFDKAPVTAQKKDGAELPENARRDLAQASGEG